MKHLGHRIVVVEQAFDPDPFIAALETPECEAEWQRGRVLSGNCVPGDRELRREHSHRTAQEIILQPDSCLLPLAEPVLEIAAGMEEAWQEATGVRIPPTTRVGFTVPMVLRYHIGGFYKRHLDHSPHDKRPRVLSVLLYLDTPERGGELDFPGHGVTIKPEAGMAAVFPSYPPYYHQSMPLVRGNKRAFLLWLEHSEDVKLHRSGG